MRRIVLWAFLAAAAGCAHPTSSAQPVATANPGNASAGRTVFVQNCAACHGATGVEGGVGPSLRGESRRKDLAATIAWIEDPDPPMPKLYPSPLNEQAVDDVAAYVQKL